MLRTLRRIVVAVAFFVSSCSSSSDLSKLRGDAARYAAAVERERELTPLIDEEFDRRVQEVYGGLEGLEKDMDTLASKDLDVLDEEVRRLRDDLDEYEVRAYAMELQLSQAAHELETLEQAATSLTERQVELRQRWSELSAEREAMRHKERELIAELEDAKARFEEAADNYRAAEENWDSINDMLIAELLLGPGGSAAKLAARVFPRARQLGIVARGKRAPANARGRSPGAPRPAVNRAGQPRRALPEGKAKRAASPPGSQRTSRRSDPKAQRKPAARKKEPDPGKAKKDLESEVGNYRRSSKGLDKCDPRQFIKDKIGPEGDLCMKVTTRTLRRWLDQAGCKKLAGRDVDHIWPNNKGGPDNLLNYVLLDSGINRSMQDNLERLPEKCEIIGKTRCVQAVRVRRACSTK